MFARTALRFAARPAARTFATAARVQPAVFRPAAFAAAATIAAGES